VAKKKKGGRTAVARRKSGKAPKKPAPPADSKKIQRQIYITRDLIDGLEVLREEKQDEMREKLGQHYDLSWSQFAGSILHDHVKKIMAKRNAK
jgi:hypothetical protein